MENRADLEIALEIPGIGDLNHPIYVAIEVQAGEFRVTSDQTKIGEFVFDMNFYSSDAEVTPNALPDTSDTVLQFGVRAGSILNNLLEDFYNNPSNPLELDVAATGILDTLDAVQDGMDSVLGPIESRVATAQAAVADFRNKVKKIMQTATEFKNSIVGIYDTFAQISGDINQLSTAWDNLWNVNRTLSKSTITESRKRSEENKKTILDHTKTTALIGLHTSIAGTTYDDTDSLDAAAKDLDNKYDELINNNVTDLDITLLTDDVDLRNAMSALRSATKSVLNSQSQNVWQTQNTNAGKTSFALLSHRYYGSIDNLTTLINLNPDLNVSNINQTVKTITK
jgi:prophage DNA circulation protein